ncbi:uncharacterized protein MELLADRAFT_63993 [Melampsora larici-populina 98AG31]|uniref:Uncharacterized protein n=1 Tax=Melampsora larici-populina (strain 98AG31 / pathotype 3-4-7) TaxID=747676 RepID=F4RPR8_MELLP|nr:uncharacterized protein MELLADRAFT_63993 [Melampsora larici-populina 98AG31]EGG05593.1 hypothetical protein MELLADRAFT_63993 [Melampsora larici-populina 98AG31]
MSESEISSKQHSFAAHPTHQQDNKNKNEQLHEGLAELRISLDSVKQKMMTLAQNAEHSFSRNVEQRHQNERKIEDLSTALKLADRRFHKLERKVQKLDVKIDNMETEAYITNSKVDGHDKVFKKIIAMFGSIDLQGEYDSYESASQKAAGGSDQ